MYIQLCIFKIITSNIKYLFNSTQLSVLVPFFSLNHNIFVSCAVIRLKFKTPEQPNYRKGNGFYFIFNISSIARVLILAEHEFFAQKQTSTQHE